MRELKIYDKAYTNSLNTTYNQLVKTYSDILENYNFDLTKNEISDAILDRIKCYYLTQNDIKIFLNKRYQAAGADYFVETVLFYLQVYLQSKGGELQGVYCTMSR
jgi:adenosine deaminase